MRSRFLGLCLRTLTREERGQSLAEFALVSLPLLLLLLGILEFGWLFNGQIAITGAAREGARAAVVGGENPCWDAVWDAVENHVSSTALTVTDVFATEGGGSDNRWQLVQVTGQIEPLVGLFVTNTVNLTAEATMRIE